MATKPNFSWHLFTCKYTLWILLLNLLMPIKSKATSADKVILTNTLKISCHLIIFNCIFQRQLNKEKKKKQTNENISIPIKHAQVLIHFLPGKWLQMMQKRPISSNTFKYHGPKAPIINSGCVRLILKELWGLQKRKCFKHQHCMGKTTLFLNYYIHDLQK